jgi:hypothetical protein
VNLSKLFVHESYVSHAEASGATVEALQLRLGTIRNAMWKVGKIMFEKLDFLPA